ncbi:ATP/GTP-binding protein [Persicitalea jodogahamensis]|uniref:ATP-binding protein n=1 Tax=Persicitalea jodogahamensis TaxID=402147 RepID=A0A8J3GB40_9BACT|nr:ATP/GTP-binding protein [Persicitalea jodogahamensis]GHB79415.1 ATP-binding protein [Persicitalea jodogahamensis]
MNIKPFILLASLGLLASCDTKNDEGDGMDSTTVAEASLEQIWATDTTLMTPESVLLNDGTLYVSLIDGQGGDKDGKGGVAKVGTDGQIIDANWVTGLSAPKGMGITDGNLYVTDLTELVQIDLATGKIVKKMAVDGAAGLNDVSVGSDGTIYFSDKNTGKIHTLKDGAVATYHEGIDNPNGVLAVSDGLLYTESGKLQKIDAQKNVTTLAEGMDKSTDGIEEVSPGEYLVSCWAGEVYHVKDGTATKLLDTKDIQSNTADIGYDAAKKIVYVPTFFKNKVVAYQLK